MNVSYMCVIRFQGKRLKILHGSVSDKESLVAFVSYSSYYRSYGIWS